MLMGGCADANRNPRPWQIESEAANARTTQLYEPRPEAAGEAARPRFARLPSRFHPGAPKFFAPFLDQRNP